jgi:hypothetical protein
MIKTIALIFIAAALLAAQDQRHEAVVQSIPNGATQAGSNLYRFTDTNGKTWLYSRTPFGLSKREDKPAKQSANYGPQLVTVTDLGDSVRFERKVPFGITTWVSKKNELTDGEQAMLLREQLKNQPAASAAQGKE